MQLFQFAEDVGLAPRAPVAASRALPEPTAADLATYDHIIVAFSGRKESLACLLHLLELGADRSRMEFWHHDVDGGRPLMDWPVTTSYCRAIADAFGIPLRLSWREGGFEREMLRQAAPTAPVIFEHGDGTLGSSGGDGPPGTRLRFPQVSPDLSVRWCSAYLKIMPGEAALRGDPRFVGKRTLFVTGERAEESAGRARYARCEPHRADTRDGARRARHIDHWRPIHAWSEREVWAIVERHRVAPHPCYSLAISRASCAFCIFGAPDQWATLRYIWPQRFEAIAAYEDRFGTTIKTETVKVAGKAVRRPVSIRQAVASPQRSRSAPAGLAFGRHLHAGIDEKGARPDDPGRASFP
jgi:3'-phosphoadenosine 5'-phosphosulfate sulfotransferase (PAPS reductase)/FAD synthetase